MPEWSDIWKVLLGFVVGLPAGFYLKVVMVRRSSDIATQQKGNIVGGNQAGRDVKISGDRQK